MIAPAPPAAPAPRWACRSDSPAPRSALPPAVAESSAPPAPHPAAPDPAAPLVLKFGSSVLRRPGDYPRVARTIGAEVARDHKVVVVASAMGSATDALVATARQVSAEPPDRLLGALLATGEEASVALLSLALAERGIATRSFTPWQLPVRTRGALMHADPVAVDAGRIRDALGTHDAVILPGFIGMDPTGVPSLLGRGGSDLTALFLGHALGAAEIRLVKDVNGIYPADPRRPAGSVASAHRNGDSEPVRLRPFRALACHRVRAIGGDVVQPRALDFAEERGISFRVTGLGGRGTTIGPIQEAIR